MKKRKTANKKRVLKDGDGFTSAISAGIHEGIEATVQKVVGSGVKQAFDRSKRKFNPDAGSRKPLT